MRPAWFTVGVLLLALAASLEVTRHTVSPKIASKIKRNVIEQVVWQPESPPSVQGDLRMLNHPLLSFSSFHGTYATYPRLHRRKIHGIFRPFHICPLLPPECHQRGGRPARRHPCPGVFKFSGPSAGPYLRRAPHQYNQILDLMIAP